MAGKESIRKGDNMNNATWADGSRMSGDANIAAEVCAKLEAEGRLNAQNLVDVSRDKDAPLHDMFEWDDSIAAEKYREEQAKKIIRSIVYTVEDKPITTRVFQSVGPKSYEKVERIMQSDEKRKYLLNAAKAELAAFKRKYQVLSELSEVFVVIDKVNAS